MPWSMSLYIKYRKFWSVSLGHFIKHNPLISEECTLYLQWVHPWHGLESHSSTDQNTQLWLWPQFLQIFSCIVSKFRDLDIQVFAILRSTVSIEWIRRQHCLKSWNVRYSFGTAKKRRRNFSIFHWGMRLHYVQFSQFYRHFCKSIIFAILYSKGSLN